MNTFAFRTNRTARKARSEKFRRRKKIFSSELTKTLFRWWVAVTCFIIYLILVTQNSTRGFFLREASQDLDRTAFEHEIIKTQLLKIRQEKRANTIQGQRPPTTDPIKVFLPEIFSDENPQN